MAVTGLPRSFGISLLALVFLLGAVNGHVISRDVAPRKDIIEQSSGDWDITSHGMATALHGSRKRDAFFRRDIIPGVSRAGSIVLLVFLACLAVLAPVLLFFCVRQYRKVHGPRSITEIELLERRRMSARTVGSQDTWKDETKRPHRVITLYRPWENH